MKETLSKVVIKKMPPVPETSFLQFIKGNAIIVAGLNQQRVTSKCFVYQIEHSLLM